MLLVPHRDGPRILLTRRTPGLSAFAGHLSFPGGRRDPGDRDALDTALRETEEEIGLRREHLRVLGYFTEMDTHFGILVVCYAAEVDERRVPHTPASRIEVDEMLLVPIRSLLAPDPAARPPDDPRVYVATHYEARALETQEAPARTVHYWTLSSRAVARPTILWGITGELISRFLKEGYDWNPPAGPTLVSDYEDLQP